MEMSIFFGFRSWWIGIITSRFTLLFFLIFTHQVDDRDEIVKGPHWNLLANGDWATANFKPWWCFHSFHSINRIIYISNVTQLSLRNNNHHRLFDSKRAGIINYSHWLRSVCQFSLSHGIAEKIAHFSLKNTHLYKTYTKMAEKY
jgi:hypothetical protein